MANEDISRIGFDAKKHYAGVRALQGRVFLDSDANDANVIEEEARRLALLDVIGVAGSPDEGFSIGPPAVNAAGEIDFPIGAGSFYLGGRRLVVDPPDLGTSSETFATQIDWLQQSKYERRAPVDGEIDLVFLESWQQPVTATEDGELFEQALGGPDTSVRVRDMRRVRLLRNVPAGDCASAWKAFVDANGQTDGEGALASDGVSLTVTFVDDGTSDDLCSPAVQGGYLGAENQAVRVELLDGATLVWGFDNGSSIYRVQIAAGTSAVTFITQPKDDAHWPRSGQVVEVIGWSAVLPNGEKLADTRAPLPTESGTPTSFFTTVATSYDPDARTITLAASLPNPFASDWQSRTDQAALLQGAAALIDVDHDSETAKGEGDGVAYVFLRVWDRGADTSTGPVPYAEGAPVALGNTGLRVIVRGAKRRSGDYWVVAARPETPHDVVPWNLRSGRAPHGVRRFYAPLGTITWSKAGTGWTADVHDCRPTFLPLTKVGGCCTLTVGDGIESHGAFDSIQKAVDHLPITGGEICVLAGVHHGPVKIENKQHVVIHGCGPRTRVVVDAQETAAVFTIGASHNITLRDMQIEATSSEGVRLNPPRYVLGRFGRGTDRIVLEHLVILTRDRSAIYGPGVSRVRVIDVWTDAQELPERVGTSDAGLWPAIFLSGDELLIESCRIAVRGGVAQSRTAAGGIQIGGYSSDVEIRRNTILGGTGNGITLGSVVWVNDAQREMLTTDWIGAISKVTERPLWWGRIFWEDGCIHVGPIPQPPGGGGDGSHPVPDGDLFNVRILDNEIANMGASGISVVEFFPLDSGEIVIADQLEISANTIHDCLALDQDLPDPIAGLWYAFGGITLGSSNDVLIRNNRIEDNGTTKSTPTCGIFVLHGTDLRIEGNRIAGNGVTQKTFSRSETAEGGIVLMAIEPRESLSIVGFVAVARTAVRIHENVVQSLQGPAILTIGIGTISVHGNQLTSRGWSPFLLYSALLGSEDAVGLTNDSLVDTKNRATLKKLGVHAAGLQQVGSASGALQELLSGGAVVTIFNYGRSANEIARTNPYRAFFASGNDVYTSDSLHGIVTPSTTWGSDVLVNDNQISFDPRTVASTIVASVLILSADDAAMENNQCGVRARRCSFHAIVLGLGSVRVQGNRFREPSALFSAITMGVMNDTSRNQGDHCFFVVAPGGLSRNDNMTLNGFGDRCKESDATASAMGASVNAARYMVHLDGT